MDAAGQGDDQPENEAAQIADQQEDGSDPRGDADDGTQQAVGIYLQVGIELPQRVGIGAVEASVNNQSKTEKMKHNKNILS